MWAVSRYNQRPYLGRSLKDPVSHFTGKPAEYPCALNVSCNSSNLQVSSGFFFLVAFQLLDTDNDGCLSYSELFSLFRMVTGPTFTDDHILGIITSILSRSDLQQPTRLTFEEFTNVSHGSVL